MEARAKQRFVRIAPRKLRVVVDLVRGREVEEALTTLKFTPRSGAKVVSKLLVAAQANAQQKAESRGRPLFVHSVYVDEGPTLKRVRPRARGMRDIIGKRTSHITVVVAEREEG